MQSVFFIENCQTTVLSDFFGFWGLLSFFIGPNLSPINDKISIYRLSPINDKSSSLHSTPQIGVFLSSQQL